MPDEYGNIEVTPEEMGSLSKVEDTPSTKESDPTPAPSNEAEASEEVNEEVREESKSESESPNDSEFSEDEYEIQIGDNTFDIDKVLEWKSDSDNKTDWNKANTQKAQAIARGGRLLQLIDNDDNFKEHLKEYFYGDDKEVKKYGLDKEFGVDFDKVPENRPQPQAQMRDPRERMVDPLIGQMYERVVALEDEKLGRSIGDRYDEIKDTNPNFFKEESHGIDFLNFCNEKGVIVDNDIDMEASFKLWSYDKIMSEENRKEQLYNNKMRNEGSQIGNSEIGAKEIRSGEAPKDYKDISMDNPDVSRYFNT